MKTSEYTRKQLRELFRYWTNYDLRLAMTDTDSEDYKLALRRELIENRNANPATLPE